MGATSIKLPNNVKPGKTIDLSIGMKTPNTEGLHIGKWALKGGNDKFGYGSNDKSFKVRIKVVTDPHGTIYDFVDGYCSAEWRNNTKILPCPGNFGASSGFVLKDTTPTLEDNLAYNPGLWTHPKFNDNNIGFNSWEMDLTQLRQEISLMQYSQQFMYAVNDDGFIRGVFPAVIVGPTDHLKVPAIGCRKKYTNCSFTYEISQLVNDENPQLLIQGVQTYDGVVASIDIDLAALAGNYVNFKFRVIGPYNSSHNAAIWIQPQIWRP